VGFGIETDVGEAAAVIREQGGIVFWGPEVRGADGRRMAIGVTRDRHFFELLEGASSPVAGVGERRSGG
jgi:hypothetical protein